MTKSFKLFKKIYSLFLSRKKMCPRFIFSKNKALITIILALSGTVSLYAQYSALGGLKTPYEISVSHTPTMEKIIVFNTFSNATLSYKTTSGMQVRWFRYATSANDKTEIPTNEIEMRTVNGETTYTIQNLQDAHGYFVTDGSQEQPAVWITDYTLHKPTINNFYPLEADDKCEFLKLIIEKTDDWTYFLKSGEQQYVERKYKISYEDLEWNETALEFQPTEKSTAFVTVGTEYIIDAPLKDTQFTLSGDEIGNYFGQSVAKRTETYQAVAVKGHIHATQHSQSEILNPGELGGSAPAIITFTAYANEPVAHHYTWFIFHGDNPDEALARYTDAQIEYTFEKAGNYIVKLEVANVQSTCVDSTQFVQFAISESLLTIPNYFSPDATDGTPTEFKVAYKSLITFHCAIFNRWGVKLHQFSDPSQGWDGKYNGRFVPTGVYYYVIEARGSDGKVYKKGGDINVIRTSE